MKVIKYLYAVFLVLAESFWLLSNQARSKAQFQFFECWDHDVWDCLQDYHRHDEHQRYFAWIKCFEFQKKSE